MKIDIQIEDEGFTIKEYLRKIGFSQKLYKAIKNHGGKFLRNGETFPNWEKLKKRDVLTLVLPIESVGNQIAKVAMPLDIVFEDEYFLILNKLSGIAVIPTTKHFNKSLANGIAYYYEENKIHSNIHYINRLDAETTGLIMLAKNRYIHYVMTKDIKISIQREYIAQVSGHIEPKTGVINAPIKALSKPSILRVIDQDGLEAITQYEVLSESDTTSYVKCVLQTGRTHQIRVHMKHIGHPLIGDKLYGYQSDRMFLHSYKVAFKHPITQKDIVITNYPSWYQVNI